jgi:uncharacterized protein (TIGR00369 family)
MKQSRFALNSDGVLTAWKKLSRLPGGKALFSRFIGMAAPYTGTMGAKIQELEKGRAVVTLREKRRIRNHLNSVHAMALANLGELATGITVISMLPPNSRAILVGFSVTYLKKARGLLTAKCQTPALESNEKRELEVIGDIFDESGQLVSKVQAKWLVGPEKK